MYGWVIPYVLFVILLLSVIFITVHLTYTELHRQQEGFVSGAPPKCVLFTQDNPVHPWDNKDKWLKHCETQDPESLVAGIEALVNLGNVKDPSAISPSNLKRVFFPIGITEPLHMELTKGMYDVYPKYVYVKKGYKITLVNEDKSITKTYTKTTSLDSEDTKTFMKAIAEIKELVPETEDVSSDIRSFSLEGRLKSKMNSNFCVTAKKDSTNVVMSECTPDYLEQKWKRDTEGHIVSLANKKCLQVQNDNTIVQNSCDQIPRQVWNTDTENRLLAKNSSSMCLQPNGDSVVEGANLVMKDCKKDMIQHWIM